MKKQNDHIITSIKKVYYTSLFIFALGASVYMLFLIAGRQMNYISYLLYDQSYLAALYQFLDQYVLRKLLFAVIFLLASLAMLYLFYFSYYQITYLKLSLLCLMCELYVMTLIETDTIFYTGVSRGYLWQNSALCSCILLVLFLTQLAFQDMLDKHTSLLSILPTAACVLLCIPIISRRYSSNLAMVPWIFSVLGILLLFFAALCLADRNFRTFFQALPVLAACGYLLYANLRFRQRNYSIAFLNRSASLYYATLYIAVTASGYLLAVLLLSRRRLLMHNRNLNKQIMELEKSKYLLLGIYYSNVKNHLYSAGMSLESISANGSLSGTQEQEIQNIKRELAGIDTLYNQIHSYTIFSGDIMDSHKSHVNMELFLRALTEKLQHSDILRSTDHVRIAVGRGYADFQPEELLPSLEDLIILLRRQNSSGQLSIRGERKASEMIVTLQFTSALPRPQSEKKSLRTILRPDPDFIPDLSSVDYTVSLIRHQIQKAGGYVRASGAHGFSLRISLPVSSVETPPYFQKTIPCVSDSGKQHKSILFISSDSVQMQEIYKILPTSRYHVTLSNDGDYFMDHPGELGAFSLIIMGDMYRHAYFRDFYAAVRRDYPMTALPILLLLPNLHAENSFYIRSTVNDYIISPYSQVALSKKIHALMTVKKTADLALETQMEFWQSQINPHFIFNSINSIMQLCIKEPMTAYNLLGDFSEYLRGHLLSQPIDRTSTIQKEIDLISAYLAIEKARFGDKIQYDLDVDCDRDFPILPLLIEPLVENSIKHSSMHSLGVSVGIRIFQMDDQLIIQVQDNGNGMDGEIISRILSNTFESNSIGLSNVCSRLRHYYHTLPVIESTPGGGTTVQFTIKRTEPDALHAPVSAENTGTSYKPAIS